MKARELFCVLTRSLGLWIFVRGLVLLPEFVKRLGPYRDDGEFVRRIVQVFISVSGLEITVACVLFFGAGWITRLAFGRSTTESDFAANQGVLGMSHAMPLDGQALQHQEWPKSAELLGVAVRAIGVWQIATGIWFAPALIFALTNKTPLLGDDTYVRAAWTQFGYAGTSFVAGIVLFSCANLIVRLAYGPQSTDGGLSNSGAG